MATTPTITFSPSDIDRSAPVTTPVAQPGGSGATIAPGQGNGAGSQPQAVPGAPITFSPSDIDHNAPAQHIPVYLANDPKFQAMSPQEQQEVLARHARGTNPNIVANQPQAGWGGTYESIGTGFAKGAAETVQTIGKVGRNALAAAVSATNPNETYEQAKKDVTPNFISNDKGTGLFDALDTEAENTPEKVGKVAESVFEFITGDEALKGLGLIEKVGLAQKMTKLAQESPYIAKALNIGLNAVRTGIVGGVQGAAHGEDAEQAIKTGLLTGGFSAGGEVLSQAASSVAGKLADYVKKFDPTTWKELELPVLPETTTHASNILDSTGKPIQVETPVFNPDPIPAQGRVITQTLPAAKAASPLKQLATKYGPGVIISAIIYHAPISLPAKLMLEQALLTGYGFAAKPRDAQLVKQLVDRPAVINAGTNLAKAVGAFGKVAPVVGATAAQQAQQ